MDIMYKYNLEKLKRILVDMGKYKYFHFIHSLACQDSSFLLKLKFKALFFLQLSSNFANCDSIILSFLQLLNCFFPQNLPMLISKNQIVLIHNLKIYYHQHHPHHLELHSCHRFSMNSPIKLDFLSED